ncbi:PE-PPE, C-terminal domain protein, precursor [Mycolicibacterium brisbanense]|uniref:PE-PPE, C-terminal domain protein n=1 Tax=Mycolicibacterium brisbanense TaxID=146020 RepID=A0A100W5F6_9MYCO|nr:PE-PPE, C-terminal domain protein, precursor [Mycolicibacterium brisbanense]
MARAGIVTSVVFALATCGSITAQATTTLYVPGTSPSPQQAGTVSLAWMGPAVTQFASTAYQIGYPASLYPFEGTIALDPSVAQGVTALDAAIRAVPPGEPIQVIGVSQGDVVLSVEEQALLANPPANTDITFVRLADPTSPTGIMGRDAGLQLPGITFVAAPQTPYNTVIINRQYDGIADWPANQLNILADVNAILGAVYLHNQVNYGVDLSTIPASDITTTTNSMGGTTTTYLIPYTGLLPILRPLQSLGVNEQLLEAVQVPLKRMIDSAYTTSTWSPAHKALAAVGQAAFLAVVNTASRIASDIGGALQKLTPPPGGIAPQTTARIAKTAPNPVAALRADTSDKTEKAGTSKTPKRQTSGAERVKKIVGAVTRHHDTAASPRLSAPKSLHLVNLRHSLHSLHGLGAR